MTTASPSIGSAAVLTGAAASVTGTSSFTNSRQSRSRTAATTPAHQGRPFSLSPFPHSTSTRAPRDRSTSSYHQNIGRRPRSSRQEREDDEPEIIVTVRIHERSYSDQEVIISAECITLLPAFSYESDLVELMPITPDSTENQAGSTSAADPDTSDSNHEHLGVGSSSGANSNHNTRHRSRARDRDRDRARHYNKKNPTYVDKRGRSRNPPTHDHHHHHHHRHGKKDTAPKYFLFKAKPDPSPHDQRFQISVHDSIANAFGFKAYSRARIRKVSSQQETLDHIELTFREQYVGRAEMWRLAMSLEDRCVYVGQKINFAGIVRATVTRLWINERRVHCGYVAANTKPIFRSESAKINLFIQLAREMWEFDEDGELYYEKCLTGFIPALLKRWRAAETNHVISVILFARVFYDEHEVVMLRQRHPSNVNGDPTNPASTHSAPEIPIRQDAQGRYYADYFKVVLDLESHPDWAGVMEHLKEEFFRFQHDILLIRKPHHCDLNSTNAPTSDTLETEKSRIVQETPLYKSGYQDSRALRLVLREQVALAGSLSYSYEGSILEAINLTLNPFDEHFIDRDLTRTGLSLIFVTAGTGHFEVDKKMLRVTTERMIECGIGLDLVCLTKMPLHSVPLFKFRSELPDPVDYHYPDRWDQAGTNFGRPPTAHRPSIPTTVAHPQLWAPKNATVQAPDPLYFDSARSSVSGNSALQSPQITTSSAASTFGRASTNAAAIAAAMSSSNMSSGTANTISAAAGRAATAANAPSAAMPVKGAAGQASSQSTSHGTKTQAQYSKASVPASTSSQQVITSGKPHSSHHLNLNLLGPSQIEFYSMPHWIDCSFYNLQMDKPFRADRFVPRCKMFEVQMMGIMENELADISIPYLDERVPVKVAGGGPNGKGGGKNSMPGTPGVGLPRLSSKIGAGAGLVMPGSSTVMSPYGLGTGYGSFGLGTTAGATLTNANIGLAAAAGAQRTSKLSSTNSIASSTTSNAAGGGGAGSYFDDVPGGGSTSNVLQERKERAERQLARDQFDEELFRPAEPAHTSGLINAQGQVVLYGTGADPRILVGDGPSGAAGAAPAAYKPWSGSTDSQQQVYAGQSPSRVPPGMRVSAQPSRPQSPRPISSRVPHPSVTVHKRDEPSSISPEKHPLPPASRRVTLLSTNDRRQPVSSRIANPAGAAGTRPTVNTNDSNASNTDANEPTSPDSTTVTDSPFRPFRLLMSRTASQAGSIYSVTSTTPTVRRGRAAPGTYDWMGKAMPAEATPDSAAVIWMPNGMKEEDGSDGHGESADESTSTTASGAARSQRHEQNTTTKSSDANSSSVSNSSKLTSGTDARAGSPLPPVSPHASLVVRRSRPGSRDSPAERNSPIFKGRMLSPAPPPGRPQSAILPQEVNPIRNAAAAHQHPAPKSMADLLRRGLSWWGAGSGPASPTSTRPSASIHSVEVAGSSSSSALGAKLDTSGEAYRTLQEKLTAAARSTSSVSGGHHAIGPYLLGAGGAVGGTSSTSKKRPPTRPSVSITSPEVPKVINPRQISVDIKKKSRPSHPSLATSPTSTPIAIGPQTPTSRTSQDHIHGQSQREVWEQNAQEAERVRQGALESERARQMIAAQIRIEKQTLVNPSNPHKNRATFSSQLGRWQHLFPTRTNRHTVKWLSMTSPACLPLTTLYLPLEADLAAHWKESPYTITASTDAHSILTKRNATTAPAVAIVREMASQRLAQGFQFIVPSAGWNNDEHLASLRAFDSRSSRNFVLKHHPSDLFQAGILTSGHPVFLSLPNEIHQIWCDQGLVKVKRYLRNTEYDTSPIEYACFIWPRNSPSYQTVHASFKYPDSAAYDWNYLDSIISGVEEPRFTESLRYWRTRFVVVPSEDPPKEGKSANGLPLSDEEVRLMGMDKLADLFMKARFRFQAQHPGERGRANKGWDLRFLPTSLDPAASVHDENFMRALEQFVQERAKERERDTGVPAKGKRIVDLDLAEIVKEMWKEDGLKIHDRLWHRIWYSDAFTGAEFVTWLCRKFDDVKSREEGVEWGTKLQQLGLFEHAGKARAFIDGHAFYSVRPEWASSQPSKWYNKARQHQQTHSASRKPEMSDGSPAAHRRRRVQMSHTLYVDLASGRKSDRYETAILHHDIAHNPANGFNFQVHWLGTTARFVEDTIRNWTATVERYGLRLIEAPVGQIKDISKHNPFQAPMHIKLAVAPPPIESYAHLLPVHVIPEQYFEYELLRGFGFILDQEAADRYPDNIEIVYESRPPRFDYSQFVHRSGIAFVQVVGGEAGFLWLNNRLFTSHLPASSRVQNQRAASRGGADLLAQTPTANVTAQAQADAELLRQDLTEFCADREELLFFYEEVRQKLQERADSARQAQASAIPATPVPEGTDSAAIKRKRHKDSDILWAK
ncbi:vacuolar membrane-associated protein iml1 [Tilletia horrida]|nr:vacuolar membrane-associated protein iml1 [Tilletia horrida]